MNINDTDWCELQQNMTQDKNKYYYPVNSPLNHFAEEA